MEHLFQTIFTLLGEDYGHRNTPGWIIVLAGMISIYGSVVAKNMLAKKLKLRSNKSKSLETTILNAKLFSDEDGAIVEYTGSIKKLDSNEYSLRITSNHKKIETVIMDETMSTIDDIADHLRKNTKFILADFK